MHYVLCALLILMLFSVSFSVMRVIKLYCRSCAQQGTHTVECPDRPYYPPVATLLGDSNYVDSVTIENVTVQNEECDALLLFKATNMPAFENGRSLVESKSKFYWSRTPLFLESVPAELPLPPARAQTSKSVSDTVSSSAAAITSTAPVSIGSIPLPPQSSVAQPVTVSSVTAVPVLNPVVSSAITTPIANTVPFHTPAATVAPYFAPPPPPPPPSYSMPSMYNYPPYPYPQFYPLNYGTPVYSTHMPPPSIPPTMVNASPPVNHLLPNTSTAPPVSLAPVTPQGSTPVLGQPGPSSVSAPPVAAGNGSFHCEHHPGSVITNHGQNLAPNASSQSVQRGISEVQLAHEWETRRAPTAPTPGIHTPLTSSLPSKVAEKLDLALLREIVKFTGDKNTFRTWKHQIEQLRGRYDADQFLAIIKSKLDTRPTEYMLTLGSRAANADDLLEALAQKYCKYGRTHQVINDFDTLKQGTKSLSDHHVHIHSLIEALHEHLSTRNPYILHGYVKSLENYQIRLKLNRKLHDLRSNCTLEDLMWTAENEEAVRACSGSQSDRGTRPAATVAAAAVGPEVGSDQDGDSSDTDADEAQVNFSGKKRKNGSGKKPFRSGKGWDAKNKNRKRGNGGDDKGDRKRYRSNNQSNSDSKSKENTNQWCIIHCTSEHGWKDCRDKDLTECKYCGEGVKAGQLYKHIPQCGGLECRICDKIGHSTKKHDVWVMRKKFRDSFKQVKAVKQEPADSDDETAQVSAAKSEPGTGTQTA